MFCYNNMLFFSKHWTIPDHPVENLSTHRESMGSLVSKIIMAMKLAHGPVHHGCCDQLWVWHMICGQTCDGLYHFAFYLVNFGIPLGSHPIKSARARHTGVQVPVVPAKVITWSFLTNHKARSAWALVYRGKPFWPVFPEMSLCVDVSSKKHD